MRVYTLVCAHTFDLKVTYAVMICSFLSISYSDFVDI